MKRTSAIWVFTVVAATALHAQVVTVADMTLRIAAGEEKELFYGFAAGDEILFSFAETGNRKIRSVEVGAWPEQLRYSAWDVSDTREQKIAVPATGVYRFSFRNAGGLGGERICKVSIKRRAASEDLRLFDTGVRWEERQDTFYRKGNKEWQGWTDHADVQTRKVLVRSDTTAVTILEKTERIFSRSGLLYGGNAADIRFRLPQNQYLPDKSNPMYVSEVTGWAYWIGVGDEADRSYQDANAKAVARLADAAAGLKLITASGGYGALALLAIKGVALFSNPPKGDNVRYALWNDNGIQLDGGNSIVAFRRMEKPLQGDFLLQLQNDNVIDGINVSVKVLAIVHTQTFREEAFTTWRRLPLPPEQRDGVVVLRKIRIPLVGGI